MILDERDETLAACGLSLWWCRAHHLLARGAGPSPRRVPNPRLLCVAALYEDLCQSRTNSEGASSTRILGKAIQDAVRNTKRLKRRCTPTQDPSTDLAAQYGADRAPRDGRWNNKDGAAHHCAVILALWSSHCRAKTRPNEADSADSADMTKI